MKAIKQENGDEVITLQWASDTAASHLKLAKGYLDEMVKQESPVKRATLANKVDEALSTIVISSEMVGILSDEGTLLSQIFGGDGVVVAEIKDPEEVDRRFLADI